MLAWRADSPACIALIANVLYLRAFALACLILLLLSLHAAKVYALTRPCTTRLPTDIREMDPPARIHGFRNLRRCCPACICKWKSLFLALSALLSKLSHIPCVRDWLPACHSRTFVQSLSHMDMHSHTFSFTHYRTFSVTHSVSHSHSHTFSFTHSHTFRFTHSVSHIQFHTFSHIQSHAFILTHSISHIESHTFRLT